jgi:hypothetical protein
LRSRNDPKHKNANKYVSYMASPFATAHAGLKAKIRVENRAMFSDVYLRIILKYRINDIVKEIICRICAALIHSFPKMSTTKEFRKGNPTGY